MDIQLFIDKWRSNTGKERQNFQLFLIDLTRALGLPEPAPANKDNRDNDYVFERDVKILDTQGQLSDGRIDLYRRGHFICEGKQVAHRGSQSSFDAKLFAARNQAERYARGIPTSEGRPPFLLIVDVGSTIELYSEFSCSGGNYIPFPDPRSCRIGLEDLANPEIAERLKQVWLNPHALDPAKRSAKVTREIADTLAQLAKSLEASNNDPGVVAQFLMRCLFTMFSEDVGLLPKLYFTSLLERLSVEPKKLPAALEQLWADMDTGGYIMALLEKLPRFNGKLFKERHAVPLNRAQIDLLIAAAKADWRDVEPAIFGTLLERALNPEERHRLGAHYTPRAYVERLVLPTVIAPLRQEWQYALDAAVIQMKDGKQKEAAKTLTEFQHRLTQIRVLDPACGTGNFLYVTLEHLKRLEGEVLSAQLSFGFTDQLTGTGEGFTVYPNQLLGIEINPRAAAIAEVVLWIGYLQWHYRTRGDVRPIEPIVRDFGNIENRDAVLAYDRIELERDASGKPISRWDGKTTKKHPVTGLDVPDERAQVAVQRYINPHPTIWPQADFVVGNPPFIGASTLRRALGDGYTDALRSVWKQVPESADFVMHWWDRAAELVRTGAIKQFGLITTNSLRQTFNRRVIERHMQAKPPLGLSFAIPDHPWVDAADGAAVRIAMSCGVAKESIGRLATVIEEPLKGSDEVSIELKEIIGEINSGLSIGSDFNSSLKLAANCGISFRGVTLMGTGFFLSITEAEKLHYLSIERKNKVIRPLSNARDLAQQSRGNFAIDLDGLELDQVRIQFPDIYRNASTPMRQFFLN